MTDRQVSAWGTANRVPHRRSDWATPPWLFDMLHAEFRFTVDACASDWNCKLERYWSVLEDGLAQDWSGERVWCNPPYGAPVGAWTRKAIESGGLAVLLLPVRSESAWWCEDVLRASEIRFVRGRVHFEPPPDHKLGRDGSRPVFASAVVVFGNGDGPRVSSFPTPRIAELERQRRLPLGEDAA